MLASTILGHYGQEVLLGVAMFLTISSAQQSANNCPPDLCNVYYIPKIQEANEALKKAVDQVNGILAEQKSLINQWKACVGVNNNTTTTRAFPPLNGTQTTYTPSPPPPTTAPLPVYVAEKVASWEPCHPESNIRSVAQLDGAIYVLCDYSPFMRVFDANTFQQLPNWILPFGGNPNKYPSYIVANRFEKTLYLGAYIYDRNTRIDYGSETWRGNKNQTWFLLSATQPNSINIIGRLSVSRNGQMMYANRTHILFPNFSTSPITYNRAITLDKNLTDNAITIVETRNGSFVLYTDLFTLLLRVNPNGELVRLLGIQGPIWWPEKDPASFECMEQGPDEMLLIGEAPRNRIWYIEPDTNRIALLIPEELDRTNKSLNLLGPYFLSFDPQSQLLAVGEYQPASRLGVTIEADMNSLKLFRIKRHI